MTAIWKYALEITDEQIIRLPKWSELFCVQWQSNQPCLWARIDPKARADGNLVSRIIRTIGTGNPIKGDPGRYISTYQTPQGEVYHVFDGGKE